MNFKDQSIKISIKPKEFIKVKKNKRKNSI